MVLVFSRYKLILWSTYTHFKPLFPHRVVTREVDRMKTYCLLRVQLTDSYSWWNRFSTGQPVKRARQRWLFYSYYYQNWISSTTLLIESINDYLEGVPRIVHFYGGFTVYKDDDDNDNNDNKEGLKVSWTSRTHKNSLDVRKIF